MFKLYFCKKKGNLINRFKIIRCGFFNRVSGKLDLYIELAEAKVQLRALLYFCNKKIYSNINKKSNKKNSNTYKKKKYI
jgi:hypothetical protein